MKQDKGFLNALDDWGSVLTGTYENATITHEVVPFENINGELVVPVYYAYNMQNHKHETIEGHVYIPDGVTEIQFSAFTDCEDITNVSMPDTLKVIGEKAFMNCTKLREVAIPDAVEHIQKSAFTKCKSLKNVKLPKQLKLIDNYAFNDCDLQGELVIPEGVIIIGDQTFSLNTNLTSLKLNSNLTQIKNLAFYGCSSLSGELVIPETVKYIGLFAFVDTNIDKIYVPKDNVKDWDKDWNNRCPAEIVYY